MGATDARTYRVRWRSSANAWYEIEFISRDTALTTAGVVLAERGVETHRISEFAGDSYTTFTVQELS